MRPPPDELETTQLIERMTSASPATVERRVIVGPRAELSRLLDGLIVHGGWRCTASGPIAPKGGIEQSRLVLEREISDAQAMRLADVSRRLVRWNRKNPKGKVYPIGPNDCEKQLDAICDAAQSALSELDADRGHP